jgi:hypothetical protein
VREVACACPDCPAEARRSPWEADTVVPHVRAGKLPGYCTRLQTPRRSLDFTYATQPAQYGEPGEHHVLALLTAPRPCGSTLRNTLSWLLGAGASSWEGEKLLVCDGERPSDDGEIAEALGFWVWDRKERLGSARAFVELLRIALVADPDLEQLTYVEDDVVGCAGFLDYAKQVVIPDDVSLVSWFTYDYDWSSPPRHAGERPPTTGPAVLACRPARFFILAQACTIPRRTVDLLLRCPMVAGDRWPSKDGQDLMMAWALGDALYAVHHPILVQHAGGNNSAVKLAGGRAQEGAEVDPQDGPRSSPYYVGDLFDAASLLNPPDGRSGQ